jgi:rhodanese-related sulfurtransferase
VKGGFVIVIAVIFSVLVLTACEQAPVMTTAQKLAAAEKTADNYYELDAETANYLYRVEPNLIILDASKAYLAGHLPSAINIPADQIQSRLDEIDVTRPYLVYSNNETESKDAAKILAQATRPVYRLIGEYGTWAEQGFELDMKKCHTTYGTIPESYKHTHIWCEGDGETAPFCISAGKCHTHRILQSQNLALDSGLGPHNHYLYKP